MKYIIPLTIAVLAIATRFFYFNFPQEVVFDEVHFGKFVRAYFTGEHFFDIHPPHGKLLIAGAAKLGGFTVADDFTTIGQHRDPRALFILRLLPAIAGALLVLALYAFTHVLTASRLAASVVAAFVLFDNALIVQSRFALLDAFLLLFGFCALTFYLYQEYATRRWKKIVWLLSAGIALGMSYSIKWTGLSIAALIGIIAFYKFIIDTSYAGFLAKVATVYAVSFVIYVAGFAIHFALLPQPGPGDAYLSPGFRLETLTQRFVELNQKMYSYNAGITTAHPYASTWRAWPLSSRGIFYWQREEVPKERMRQIWLFGNPVGWTLGVAGLGISVLLLLILFVVRKANALPVPQMLLLLIAWAMNFFPYIPITRPLFLYHYLFAAVFSFVLVGIFFDQILGCIAASWSAAERRWRMPVIVGTLLLALVVGFSLGIPITYGFAYNPSGLYQSILEWLT